MKIELTIEKSNLERYGAALDEAVLSRVFNQSLRRLADLAPAWTSLPAAEAAMLDAADLGQPEPHVAEAAARDSAAAEAELLATALTVDQVAGHLEVNSSRIRQRISARELYAIRDGKRWRLPLFQFRTRGSSVTETPNARMVFPRLPKEIAPVAVARWFTLPNAELFPADADHPLVPLSPKQWLAEGYPPEPVARLAMDLAGEPTGAEANQARLQRLLTLLAEDITLLRAAEDRLGLDTLCSALNELREKTAAPATTKNGCTGDRSGSDIGEHMAGDS